ncbi:MAG TPA: lytic transglycosylase domain-containing protein [Oscillatoriaceae cyanobacterium]
MRRLSLALALLLAGCDVPIPSGVPALIASHGTATRSRVYHVASWYGPSLAGSRALSPAIAAAAAHDGLSRGLVEAVVAQESGFNPLAVSPVGAEGLMQLMPETVTMINAAGGAEVLDPFDAEQNLAGGCWYLKWLHGALPRSQVAPGEDWKLTLAAYNGGLTRVKKAIAMALAGAPRNPRASWRDVSDNMPSETQRYVPSVMALWSKYGQ